MNLTPHIEKFRRRFAEVEAALSDPKVFDNPQRAQELSREYARLKELVAQGENFLKTSRIWTKTVPCSKASRRNPNWRSGEGRNRAAGSRGKQLAQQIQFGLVPPDPTDSRNTIIEIRAGAGAGIRVVRRRPLPDVLPLRRGARMEN